MSKRDMDADGFEDDAGDFGDDFSIWNHHSGFDSANNGRSIVLIRTDSFRRGGIAELLGIPDREERCGSKPPVFDGGFSGRGLRICICQMDVRGRVMSKRNLHRWTRRLIRAVSLPRILM